MRRPFTLVFLLCLCCLITSAVAQSEENGKQKKDTTKIPTKVYHTRWVQGAAPEIDGLDNDEAWSQVEWGGGFLQQQPDDGKEPTHQTNFKILYDEKNLYILVRAWDTEPDKIVRRMSRRDGFTGDFVEVNIDSYYDKRTCFSFTASVAGVRSDEYATNNGDNWDTSWDPIWYLKTSIDDKGWIAEYKIPLSQLRFADKEEHIWGIQVLRNFFRKEERSLWQRIPQGSAGWMHLFGELHGIRGIKPQKQVEIMPFVAARHETFAKQEGNPFADGRNSELNAGVDGKIGITSDITLDFTINPDFGQVEADPSQLNLSAFQLFFAERRPFFIEGRNILNFPVTETVAGGSFQRDNLFYSRRIGRRPFYYPSLQENEYADVPDNTRILGAAKLTGKNHQGFSWGVLESVTAKTQAEIDNGGERRTITVEPRTNYLIGRAQQDINKGNTIVGGMLTATNRSIEDPHLEFLHKDAYSGGLDFLHNWKDRKYYVRLNTIFSHVRGTREAITRTQHANERLFQRENTDHVSVDTMRTSLTGTGGTLSFGKNSGDLVFQTGVTWRSPEIELNDVGFLISSDLINHWSWAQYRILKTFSIFRNLRINANEFLHFDFGGNNTFRALNMNAHVQFKNYWHSGGGGTISDRNISNADLRGGPPITYPGGVDYWAYIQTDNRKKFRLNLEHWRFQGFENYQRGGGFWMNMTYRPIDAINLSLAPSVNYNRNDQQYVTTVTVGETNRYVTARIDQNTYSMSLRFTYTITPDLTVEYWGQPFISKGTYSDFKVITNAAAKRYQDRFHTFSNDEIGYNNEGSFYDVDEDRNGTTDFTIGNPDFNFLQFRSNAVIRWEYIPGSTIFLVWTQGRTDTPSLDNENSIARLSQSLFDTTPHNIFVIKFTYRFRL